VDNTILVGDPFGVNKAPNSSQMALVECGGKRHVAIQDKFGKWRTLSRRKELLGVVEVIKVMK
jgi:hypothetical protein